MSAEQFAPLWSDVDRRRQLVRLRSARFRFAQSKQANAARMAAIAINAAAGEGDKPLKRIPRAPAFDALLQVFALAKSFDIEALELSISDFVELTGHGVSSVKRVLEALEAIGWITKTLRYGMAVVDGVRKAVYRTALRGLSIVATSVLFSGGDAGAQTRKRKPEAHKPAEQPGRRRRTRHTTASAKSGSSRGNETVERTQAVVQAPTQPTENMKQNLSQVAQNNPFLRVWVERALALA